MIKVLNKIRPNKQKKKMINSLNIKKTAKYGLKKQGKSIECEKPRKKYDFYRLQKVKKRCQQKVDLQ